MVKLHNLPSTKTRVHRRVGRGNASRGTYSGRGIKGQKARTGSRGGLKLKGAKATILRLPKNRGFKSPHPKMAVVNVETLNAFKPTEIVEPNALVAKRLISTARFGVKILGTGELKQKLTVKAHAFSATAKDAIEKAGGTVEVITSKRGIDLEKGKKPVKEIPAEKPKNVVKSAKKSSKNASAKKTK